MTIADAIASLAGGAAPATDAPNTSPNSTTAAATAGVRKRKPNMTFLLFPVLHRADHRSSSAARDGTRHPSQMAHAGRRHFTRPGLPGIATSSMDWAPIRSGGEVPTVLAL